MAVEPKYLQQDIADRRQDPVGDDVPTQDLDAGLPANDDPTEDVTGADGAAETARDCVVREDDPFQPGAVLRGRYRLERVIGRGGFSQVLRARDMACGAAGDESRWVAIKVPRPEHRGSPAAVERLAREYELLRQLPHPGVVRVLDFSRHGEDGFEVMELLDGSSLATILARRGADIPADEAVPVLRSCAAALDWIHRRGFVHGDLKPGNVFVTDSGEVRLLDVGGAASDPSSGPSTGRGEPRYATPAYASPQVLAGSSPEPADDVYGFACVAFELLAGTHPFGRAPADVVRERGLQPVRVEGSKGALAREFSAGLALEREDRPASAGELLEAALHAGAAAPTGRVTEPPIAKRASRWRVATPFVALAAVAAAVAGLVSGPRDTEVPASPIAPPSPAVARATAPGDDARRVAAAGESLAALSDEFPATRDAPVTAAMPVPAKPPIRQEVGFSSATVVVSRSATMAAIPIHRQGEPVGALRVSWRIEEGSARAGNDFGGPLAGEVSFAEGQRASTLYIPIVPGARAHGDAAFTVAQEGVTGRARVGAVSRVEVILRDFRD